MATAQSVAKSKGSGFSDAEKAAAKERVKELKRGEDREAALKDCLAKIAEMNDTDRPLAQRVHEIVTAAAPELEPKTWYGMPAYTNKDGKLVAWFKPSAKFKDRYSSFGFEQAAQLDDGTMWPIAFALSAKLSPAEEKRLAELVKKAAG